MSSTDDRIVKMQFDNAQFKKGAAETQKSLGDLDKAVTNAGKSKGLLDLNSSMQKVSVTASKMAVITTTALATIANKATNVAIGLANSLTLSPIKQGFSEYESLLTKQNTIMNATGKSAKEVKKTLADLNHFSDQTIYSFSNMTDAVTKFTNAGVPLDRAVMSIKGIANAAAFAGASSEEASRAMIGFSQAIGTGFMGLMDWTQIENANMGTVRFKTQLLEAAVAAGTLTKKGNEYITAAGNSTSATKGWRDALQDQWLSAEVLNTTLAKYTDSQTKLGRQAIQSAKEVRTFSAFMDTLKESIGSGWASIFQSLFGNLKQSTKMWTAVSEAVGGVVQGFFGWLSITLKTWRKMGGFNKLMEGFGNLLAPIAAILSTIGDAFRAAFPDSGAGSGKALYGLSAGFAAITSPLQLLADLIKLSVGPLTAFFQIIRIGGKAVKEVIGYLADFVMNAFGLIDLKAPSSGGMLDWIKKFGEAIGDTLDQISKLLDKGGSIKEVFSKVSMPDIPSLPNLPDIGGMFGGGSGGAKQASAGIGGLLAPLGGMGSILDKVGSGFTTLGDKAKTAGGDVKSAGGTMGSALASVWEWLKKVFEGINFEDVIASFNLAVLATFMISVSRFLNTLTSSFKGFTDTGAAFNRILNSTSDALGSFQTAARAKLIIAIAVAIGILALSLWLLSKVPMKDLVLRLVILAGVFGLMDNAMKKLTKMIEAMDKDRMALKLIAFSFAITAMAVAMLLLAAAFLIYNKVDIMSVVKGLAVMFATMQVMGQLANLGKLAAKNMVSGAIAIGIMAGAMIVLALALLMFKLVDWESMAKAGLVLGALTLAVGLLALIPYAGIAKVGVALLTASTGMLAFATALIMFAIVKWESIGKAAVVLAMLTLALGALMFVGNPLSISGMISMAGAMVLLAMACLMLNKVNWSSIGKAAVVLGVLLLAFAVGAAIMTAFLWAIAPLAPVIFIIALSIAALGIAMAAFSAALAIAMALAAGGTAAFAALATGAAVAIAVFVQTLAAEAPILKDAFIDMLQVFFDGLNEAVPIIIQGIKDLWKTIVEQFKGDESKKGMEDGGKTMVMSLGSGVEKNKKSLLDKAIDLIVKFMDGLAKRAGDLAESGGNLVVKILEGLSRKAGEMATAAIGLIIKFAEGISKGLDNIVKAGIQLIADFLHSLASNIRTGSGKIGAGLLDVVDAFFDVGVQMINGIGAGFKSLASKPKEWIEDVVGQLPKWAKKLLGISSPSKVFMEIGKFLVQGLASGIQDHAAAAIVSVASMVGGAIATASEYVSRFVQDLDQKAIAARATAEGLASAAEKAAKAAEKTKSKKDDKKAGKISDRAEKADKRAQRLEERAEEAKEKEQRKQEFLEATYADKAQMRSEDAQAQLDEAKAAEARAAAALVEANALDQQAKGVGKKQRKKLQAEADALRAQAKLDAIAANKSLEDAKKSAADALAYQKLAGEEAAAAFQAAFDADAKEAADEEAFEKMTDEEKAALRRKQAAELQQKAQADLERAKQLAYTDLEAANDLAEQAIREADLAREYLQDAEQYSRPNPTTTPSTPGAEVVGTVIDLQPTDAAALAMQKYSDLYSSATAAAAASRTVEFNQYNTSPEALSPSEIYRQSNNLFAYAVDKLEEAAA